MPKTCAVATCFNNETKLRKWAATICEKHNIQQNFCSCDWPFHLWPFPSAATEPVRREEWIKQIYRKDPTSQYKRWEPNDYSRICSQHFLPEGTIPTVNLGHDKKQVKERKAPKRRATVSIAKACKTKRLNVASPSPLPTPSSPLPTPSSLPSPLPTPSSSPPPLSTQPPPDHNYAFTPVCFNNGLCKCCLEKDTIILELKSNVALLDEVLSRCQEQSESFEKLANEEKLSWIKFVVNDKAVRQNTGFPSKKSFSRVFDGLKTKANRMRYWQGSKRTCVYSTRVPRQSTPEKPGPQRKLPLKAEFTMTMLKLRQGLSLEFLSTLFGVSKSTCSTTVTTWITFLAVQMKSLIHWPDLQETKQAVPAEMGALYPNLRCTMDCTEIFVQRPSHLELQAQTYSNYKNHNTVIVKFLVCISPNGLISFLSKAWVGRASDKIITLDCGVLDKLDRGDTVLADRRCIIKSDLLLRGVNLQIPPPASGVVQMSKSEVETTKKIANARIHVERAIGRLKWFNMLDSVLPITLLCNIDDILTVCAAVCNLHPPLVK